jgi:hypothetical protein
MDMFTENQSPNRKVNQCYNKMIIFPRPTRPSGISCFIRERRINKNEMYIGVVYLLYYAMLSKYIIYYSKFLVYIIVISCASIAKYRGVLFNTEY